MSGARRRLYPNAFEDQSAAPQPGGQGAPFQQPVQQQQYAAAPAAGYTPAPAVAPVATPAAAWGAAPYQAAAPAAPFQQQQQPQQSHQPAPYPVAQAPAPEQPYAQSTAAAATPGAAQAVSPPGPAAGGGAHVQKLHKRVFYTDDPEGGPSNWQQQQQQQQQQAEPVPMMMAGAGGAGVQQISGGMQQMNLGGGGQQRPVGPGPGPFQQQSAAGYSPQLGGMGAQGSPAGAGGGGYQQQQQQQPASTMTGPAETPVALVTPAAQCPSTYMRMTVNGLPQTEALFKKSNLPFGCIFHPMARSRNPQDKIPVVNFGAAGVIRCRKCRTYINPFVAFVDSGRRWRCNVCSITNDVPAEYYAAVDPSGRRADAHERPELTRGVVEFVAPSEYMVRPPQPPSYFFVIDASYPAVSSGMFEVAVSAIQAALNGLTDERTRVGFLTFDGAVHFYNLKSSLSNPQMMVVADIDDVFLPLPDDLFVNYFESKTVIESLLTKLPAMHKGTQNVDSALGVALQAAFQVVKNIGGKLVVFASQLPSCGQGRLPNREDVKLLGTDKEVNLLQAEDQYYKNFALECSGKQISMDLFLFSGQFTDVATLGCMPQFTGGQVFYYPNYKSDRDAEKLYKEVVHCLSRETGFEAVMRVRTSKGVRVQAHYGNFFIRSTDLLALPNVDADKAFAVQFALTDAFVPTKFISIQAALLYTTSNGERRIRVFTQCIPAIASMPELFSLADSEAITALTAKIAIEKALTTKLSDAREALVNKCIDVLAVYRSDVATSSSSSQLMMPETLRTFPLYVLALIKSPAFRAGTDLRPDERTYHMMNFRTASVPLLITYIYPRLYALHALPPEAGLPATDGSGVVLPPPLTLSSERLDRRGAFLLENGNMIIVWLGREISQDFLLSLFGLPTLDGVDTNQLKISPLGTELSTRVCNIIGHFHATRPLYENVYVMREGEAKEILFFSNFVEDRSKAVHSYHEFLVSLHQRVSSKLTK